LQLNATAPNYQVVLLHQEIRVMTVKASVSISGAQDRFARMLVEEGRYASLSAVVRRGIELVRAEADLQAAETEALRTLLKARAVGDFETATESRSAMDAMIARKRAEVGS
jgi:antitoxin ParD1/3/4